MSPGCTAKISFSGSLKNGTITISSSPANLACTEKLSQGRWSVNARATFGASRSSSDATTRWFPDTISNDLATPQLPGPACPANARDGRQSPVGSATEGAPEWPPEGVRGAHQVPGTRRDIAGRLTPMAALEAMSRGCQVLGTSPSIGVVPGAWHPQGIATTSATAEGPRRRCPSKSQAPPRRRASRPRAMALEVPGTVTATAGPGRPAPPAWLAPAGGIDGRKGAWHLLFHPRGVVSRP